MLDAIAAWVASVLPELTSVEPHRPVRAGHAVPLEPYATLWISAEASAGRSAKFVGVDNALRLRELRLYSVSVDIYGEQHAELAQRLYARRALPDTLRFFAAQPLTLAGATRVTHPTAQKRSTVVFRVSYCEETLIQDFPTIDTVEATL